jgi:hypothetical protein
VVVSRSRPIPSMAILMPQATSRLDHPLITPGSTNGRSWSWILLLLHKPSANFKPTWTLKEGIVPTSPAPEWNGKLFHTRLQQVERHDTQLKYKDPLTNHLANRSSVVCFEALQADSMVRCLQCHHIFHAACIDAWLLRHHTTCPLCMACYIPESALPTEPSNVLLRPGLPARPERVLPRAEADSRC